MFRHFYHFIRRTLRALFLDETEARIEKLAFGRVDTVADGMGGTFALRRAQEELRENEAARESAILNALPAHIALLDPRGVVLSVNAAWRRFAGANAMRDPLQGIGSNYLDVCSKASGPDAAEIHAIGDGIRSVLRGHQRHYSIEYPCHSPTEQRWFLLTATPLDGDHSSGAVAVLMHLDVTERRNAEMASAEAVVRLIEAQRAARLGTWYRDFVDGTGRWSEETNTIFGRPQEPAAPTLDELSTMMTSESSALLATAFRLLEEAGQRFEMELEIVHADQSLHWVAAVGEPVLDATGRVRAAQGTALDITERKRSEMALAELSERTEKRERLLNTLLSSISDFAYIYDRDIRFLFVNQPLLDLWGLPLEAVLGKNFLEIGYPEELAIKLEREVREVFATKRSFTGQTAYLSPTGVDGTYEYIFSPVIGDDGTVEFVVGSTRDITERIRYEDELRDSEQKFHQMAGSINDVFWIRSADMREVHYISPAFEQIWGRSMESLLDSPNEWPDFIVEEDRERVRLAFASLTGSTPSIDLEYRIFRPDGEIRCIRARAFQILDEAGTLIRTTGIVTDITEKQEVTAALRASEEEFRSLAQAMPQIVWVTEPDGTATYFNQQWMDYTGQTMEESCADGWSKVFHPDDQDDAMTAWRKATAEIGTYSLEVRLRRADGGYRWWLTRGVPVRDANGQVVKWFGTCTDIHDMKVAELAIIGSNRELERAGEALRESEREQRQLAEQLDVERSRLLWAQQMTMVGSWEIDLRSMVVVWSDEMFRIFETDAAAPLSPRTFLRSVHPDDRSAVEESYFNSLKSTEPYSIEHRLVLPDGRIKFVEERWQVVFDGKRPVRAVGTSQDVTERKQAENALRQSKQRLRGIIDGLGPSMFMALLTPEGILVEINRSSLEAAALEAEEVLGLPFVDTQWWKDSPDARQGLREAIRRAARGEASRYDVQAKGARGKFIDMDLSIQPLRDDSGEVVFLIASASIITERKQAEAALRQSQKLEAVGQLAAGVAHEFNNILQTLMSMATITRLRGVDPETVKIAAEMETQIRRGASVTQQLLLSSRNQELTRTSLDLREQVAHAGNLLRRLLPENIELVVEASLDRASIEGDAGQIQQVLLNLAINARDAMPDGGTISLRVAANGSEVSVEVEDDGAGFGEETREHLFEPFFTTKEVGKGTGLGLAVVYGIIEQHGGRIEVRSRVGEGSLFRILLPQSLCQVVEAEPLQERGVVGETGRILLVEDEDGVRDGLSMLLTTIGYEVIAVSRGEEAMALASTPVPDMLLSDVSLPGIGGPALAKILRTRWPELSVTLMTGYADARTREVSREEGWEILEKPFAMDDLTSHLRSAFRGGDGPSMGVSTELASEALLAKRELSE